MTFPLRPRPDRLPLSVETLEGRDQPTAGPWLVEPFQHGPAAGLPAGWGQWNNAGTGSFHVSPTTPGLGDTGLLASTGTSTTAARAWVTAPFAADVETSAAVFLNSPVPVQLFARGQNLNTTTPSYYAASITRGAQVQLVRVVAGKATVLGTVTTTDYESNRWLQVRLRVQGNQLQVYVFRGDTNQYLGPDGKWSRSPVAAIGKVDTALRNGGQVGFARPAGAAGEVDVDSLRVGPANTQQPTAIVEDRFANGAAPGLPAGWSQSAGSAGEFHTVADETLRVDGTSSSPAAWAWNRNPTPADVQVSSSLYVDSLVPAGIFARGQNLYATHPTYYGLTVTRGVDVTLTRMVNGQATVLGTVASQNWVSGLWVQASLVVEGNQLRVEIYRSDTGQYLNANGTWGLSPTWALQTTDSAIKAAGPTGLTRGAGYAGQLVFDNFLVTTAPTSLTTAGPIPTEQDKPVGPVPPPPGDTGPTVPPVVPPTVPPPVPPPPTVPPPPPPVPLPPPAAGLPTVDRHYPNIRLAELAYYGTPMGSFEQGLLKNSIDLVIPNVAYQSQIAQVAPTTPQFVYTNVSNIYLGLYTDWLTYADQHGVSREDAFLHVTTPTPYTGMSASSVQVNQFWGVYTGSDGAGWDDITSQNKNATTPYAFAARGESVAYGYPEKYMQLNFDLKAGAAAGWTGQFEYVRSVDAQGRPTSWGTLPLTSNTTAGLRQDGTVTFNPPADWVPASINGGPRLYYVRVRSATGGTAPVALTVTGRDYTNSNGQASGVIPVFDYAADTNHDGYLDDAEYAKRKPGDNARFAYESRLFYPNYGAMRFATNVADPAFQAWAVDYSARVLKASPAATGLFVDNSNGKLAVDPAGVKESLDTYGQSYAALLGAINRRIGPKGWVIANTAGGGPGVEAIAQAGVSSLNEFGLRPLSSNHVQFDDLVANLAYSRQLSGGKAYEILDSLPQGLSATDPRTETATLAMYYAVADPNLSFLMVNGGNSPSSSWTQHWIPAATYNVGKPTGTVHVVATGNDPANSSLVYKVYERDYQNAKVFYKPLSYTRGVNGTTADNTATTMQLDGWYRPLKADGSLGTAINRLTLRNGEGAILVKVK